MLGTLLDNVTCFKTTPLLGVSPNLEAAFSASTNNVGPNVGPTIGPNVGPDVGPDVGID